MACGIFTCTCQILDCKQLTLSEAENKCSGYQVTKNLQEKFERKSDIIALGVFCLAVQIYPLPFSHLLCAQEADPYGPTQCLLWLWHEIRGRAVCVDKVFILGSSAHQVITGWLCPSLKATVAVRKPLYTLSLNSENGLPSLTPSCLGVVICPVPGYQTIPFPKHSLRSLFL